jgi:hypothetical protein
LAWLLLIYLVSSQLRQHPNQTPSSGEHPVKKILTSIAFAAAALTAASGAHAYAIFTGIDSNGSESTQATIVNSRR